MTDQPYARGTVVKGPDLLGPHNHRPYVCLSTQKPPFRDEEAVYAAVTTTRRSQAIPLAAADFPVRVTSIRGSSSRSNTPIFGESKAGYEDAVDKIAREAATHIGALD